MIATQYHQRDPSRPCPDLRVVMRDVSGTDGAGYSRFTIGVPKEKCMARALLITGVFWPPLAGRMANQLPRRATD